MMNVFKKLFMSHFWVPPADNNNLSSKLSKEDITILLNVIKNSNFKGENIEQIYNLVLKLQDMYIETTKQ